MLTNYFKARLVYKCYLFPVLLLRLCFLHFITSVFVFLLSASFYKSLPSLFLLVFISLCFALSLLI